MNFDTKRSTILQKTILIHNFVMFLKLCMYEKDSYPAARVFCCAMVYGQKYVSDEDFNNPSAAAYINETFVKSFIGFDMKPEAGFVNVTKTDLPEPSLSMA